MLTWVDSVNINCNLNHEIIKKQLLALLRYIWPQTNYPQKRQHSGKRPFFERNRQQEGSDYGTWLCWEILRLSVHFCTLKMVLVELLTPVEHCRSQKFDLHSKSVRIFYWFNSTWLALNSRLKIFYEPKTRLVRYQAIIISKGAYGFSVIIFIHSSSLCVQLWALSPNQRVGTKVQLDKLH